MVKTPRTRHSRPKREPLTIDLQAEAVSARPDDAIAAALPPPDARAQADAQPEKVEAEAVREETATAAPAEAAAISEPESVGDAAPAPPNHTSDHAFAEERAAPPPPPPGPTGPRTGAAAPQSRPDRFGRLASGTAGAVVALVLAGVLQWAGVLGAPSSGTDALSAEIARMRDEIAALKQQPAQADPAALAAMQTELSALREQMAGIGQSDVAALGQRLAELETRISGLASAAGAAPDPALAQRLSAAEASGKEAADALAQLGQRLAALEQNLTDIRGKVDSQASQPQIALAIATAALKSAVDRGAPFKAELETLAAIAPDAPGLDVLRARAETGVATLDRLREDFEQAAAAMLAAARPQNPDAGILERLMQSAESLVAVRPVGEVEGDTVDARIARMEVALKAGDVGRAAQEFDALPEPAKAAAASYGEALKGRVEVEALLDQAIAAAAARS